jgi:hypothetical protein
MKRFLEVAFDLRLPTLPLKLADDCQPTGHLDCRRQHWFSCVSIRTYSSVHMAIHGPKGSASCCCCHLSRTVTTVVVAVLPQHGN